MKKRRNKYIGFDEYLTDKTENMSPEEVMAYAEKELLLVDLIAALCNNDLGYSHFCYSPVHFKNDEEGCSIFVPCLERDEEMEIPLEKEALSNLPQKAFSHPHHVQAAVIKEKDEHRVIIQYDKTSQAKEMLHNKVCLEFIQFAEIDSVEKLMKVLETGYRLFKEHVGRKDNFATIKDSFTAID